MELETTRGRLLTGAMAAALALVPLLAGVAAVRGRWTPVSDWAMIAAWSRESTSWPPPLIGMPTSLSLHTTEATSHPGPLQFWALALPTRLLGPPGYGLVVGTAVLNAAWVAVVVAALRRIGHSPLVLAGGVALAGLFAALGGAAWRDPYNPLAAILPLVVTLLAAWLVLLGRQRWLLVVAGAGSFAAQTHVSTAPVVLVTLIVTFGVVIVDRHRSRSRPRLPLPSLVVLAACWAGPLIDQVAGLGNLGRLLTGGGGGDTGRLGPRIAWDRLVDAVAPPPVWWRAMGDPATPGPERHVLAVSLLVVAATLAADAWRRRSRPTLAALVVAGVALGGAAFATALVPSDEISRISPNNRYLWWPVGMVVWLTVGTALATRLAPVVAARVPSAGRPPSWARTATAGAAMVAVVALAAVAVDGSGPRHDSGSTLYGAIRQHADALIDAAPPGGYVIELGDDPLFDTLLAQGVIGHLTMAGVHVGVPDDLADPYGVLATWAERSPATGREGAVVRVQAGAEPPEGFTRLSHYDPARPWSQYEGYDGVIVFYGTQPTSAFVRPVAGG